MEIKRFSEFIYEADGDGKLGFFENARKQIEKLKARLVGKAYELDKMDQMDLKSKVEALISKVDKSLESLNDFKSAKRRKIASDLLEEESKLMADIAKEPNKQKEIAEKSEDLDKNLKASYFDVEDARSKFNDTLAKYQKIASEKVGNTVKQSPKFEPIKTGDKDKEEDGNVRKLQTQMMSKNKEIERFLKEKGAPNGVYGKRTTAVIKAVQKNLGMKEDGILTPEIYSKIMNESLSNEGQLLMFESFLYEKEGKIDWEAVAKEISGYKDESKKSVVSKEKVDKRLELLGEIQDKSVADNMVKVIEMGGLVTKTPKGNPALVYKGITFYKNGRFFNKKWGTKGSFNSEGLKYDKQNGIFSWDELKKEGEKSDVDVAKMEGLVRSFIRSVFGPTEDEDGIFEVFKKIKTKDEFDKFEEIWNSLRFTDSQLDQTVWKDKKFDYIKNYNKDVKNWVKLREVIDQVLKNEETSRLNSYLPNGVSKF